MARKSTTRKMAYAEGNRNNYVHLFASHCNRLGVEKGRWKSMPEKHLPTCRQTNVRWLSTVLMRVPTSMQRRQLPPGVRRVAMVLSAGYRNTWFRVTSCAVMWCAVRSGVSRQTGGRGCFYGGHRLLGEFRLVRFAEGGDILPCLRSAGGDPFRFQSRIRPVLFLFRTATLPGTGKPTRSVTWRLRLKPPVRISGGNVLKSGSWHSWPVPSIPIRRTIPSCC